MMPELRVELPEFTTAVLDGHCSANGMCRTQLVNNILGEWAKQKHHEATIILRVAGSNPTLPDKK
jgi:hypothetical protein